MEQIDGQAIPIQCLLKRLLEMRIAVTAVVVKEGQLSWRGVVIDEACFAA